ILLYFSLKLSGHHHYHPKPSHHGSPPFTSPTITFSLTLSWTLDNHHQPKLFSTVRNIPPLTITPKKKHQLDPKSKLSRHHLHHFSSPITPNRPSPSPTSTNLHYQPQNQLPVKSIKAVNSFF
ncbi:hypothetical protein E1A91_D07G241300v1, partial [Gossypium mustelinum]